jgi:hypothetical protein
MTLRISVGRAAVGRYGRAAPVAFSAVLLLASSLPTASAGWAEESTLADALLNQPVVRIAGDPDGLQVAAWSQLYENRVWMSNRTAGGPWSAPVGSPAGTNQGSLLEVAVAPSAGVAIVTWREGYSGSVAPLRVAVFTAIGGWVASAELDGGGVYINDAHPAVDSAGRIVVTWAQMTTSYVYSVLARTFIVGTGWSAATQIDTGGSPTQVSLAASTGGNFMAVWPGTQRIYARPYSFTTGWGNVAGPLDSGGSSLYPNVVAASDGSWVAAWTQYTTSPYSVFVNRNVSGLAWAGPVQLADATNGTQYAPLLAAGGNGNVTVMWLGSRSGVVHLLASRLTAATGGWGPTFAIDSGATPVTAARVAWASGDIMRAVWTQGDASSVSVWTAAQAPGGAWSAPELAECRLAAASVPDVTLGPSGRAEVAFVYTEWGSSKVWWNTFDPSSADSLGRLVVTAPAQGATVSAPSVWVAGAARSDASLTVNGQAGAIAGNGSFGLRVPLVPGANTLQFTLTMPCGSMQTASVDVTYAVPADANAARIDALAAQLNSTAASVSAASAQLASLQGQVNLISADVSAHSGELAAINATLANASARLTDAQGRLAAVEGAVSALEAASGGPNASVAELEAELNVVHGDLNATRANLTRIDGQVSLLQANGGTAGPSAGASTSSLITIIVAAFAGLGIGLFIGGRRGGMRTRTRSTELRDGSSKVTEEKSVESKAEKE